MAILIADTKLETETDAWYQFYVDKMSDIADLPTSQSTGASYKVKRLARPTSIAYCIEMAAVYVLDGADQWRLMYASRGCCGCNPEKRRRNQKACGQHQRFRAGCSPKCIGGKRQCYCSKKLRKNINKQRIICGGERTCIKGLCFGREGVRRKCLELHEQICSYCKSSGRICCIDKFCIWPGCGWALFFFCSQG